PGLDLTRTSDLEIGGRVARLQVIPGLVIAGCRAPVFQRPEPAAPRVRASRKDRSHGQQTQAQEREHVDPTTWALACHEIPLSSASSWRFVLRETGRTHERDRTVSQAPIARLALPGQVLLLVCARTRRRGDARSMRHHPVTAIFGVAARSPDCT